MPISILYTGEPIDGTSGDDFIAGYQGTAGTDNNTINANGGDDLVIGDIGSFWTLTSGFSNDMIASAKNIDDAPTWSTAENPMFGDWLIPHTTVVAEATVGQAEYYAVSVAAGQTMTVDIDIALGWGVGNPVDLAVDVWDSNGHVVASNDNSSAANGGEGSASNLDPYLTFTAPSDGIYYIAVHPSASDTFTDNNTYLLNLSVTGHVTGADPVQGNDIINGGDGNDVLFGQGGDDTINGGIGNDFIDGGTGNDTLYGLAGNDTLIGGAGYDKMYGGIGDDTYYVSDVTDYAYERAGEGHDTVYSSIDHQLRLNVEDLVLTGAAIIGKGNIGDNVITGTSGANKLYGFEGNDTLNGMAGDDYLAGGDGNDTLNGGSGYDRMYGGTGNDTYIVTDTTDFAYELVGEGYDTVVASVTHILRDNIEELDLAGSADIRGYGNGIDNLIIGNSGSNQLYGRDGNDTLKGGAGNDFLYGENGNDTLEGGAGSDRFYGGAGADTFLFRDGDFGGLTSANADRLMDFNEGEGDVLNLANVDANTLLGGDQAFTFIGSAAFGHHAGELRAFQGGGTTWVQGDTNGDGLADFLIRIDGLHTLNGTDLIL